MNIKVALQPRAKQLTIDLPKLLQHYAMEPKHKQITILAPFL